MIPLSPSQLQQFENGWNQWEASDPQARDAILAGISDETVRQLLIGASKEPHSPRNIHSGMKINEFTLIEQLGAGGFGQAWLAWQPLGTSQRKVVLKFIHPDRLTDAKAAHYRSRFQQEISKLVALRHPHIAQVYAAGAATLSPDSPDHPYLVLEWINGTPLTQALSSLVLTRRADRGSLIDCFQKIGTAVQAAHQINLLHLDLKPDNILAEHSGDGSFIPKVIDFGLAEYFNPINPLNPERFGYGTLGYMAPEQLDSRLGGPSHQTDVHALGVILFQVLTRRLPFRVVSPDPHAMIQAICFQDRLRLTSVQSDLPVGLEAILLKATDRAPDKRYRTPLEFADALAQWFLEDGRQIVPRTPDPDLSWYRQKVVGIYSHHRIAVLEARAGDKSGGGQPRLDKIFIPLNTEVDARQREEKWESASRRKSDAMSPGREGLGGESPTSVPAIQRLIDHPRLVLLGTAGSGKSTLLRYVALQLAQFGLQRDSPKIEEVLPGWPEDRTDLIPLVIDLRKTAVFLASSNIPQNTWSWHQLWSFFLTSQKIDPEGERDRALQSALVQGRGWWVLDGLDEVPDELRGEFLGMIRSLVTSEFQANRFVLTCRIMEFDRQEPLPGFHVARLMDLDTDQKRLFIDRYYTELFTVGRIPEREAAGLSLSLRSAVEDREDLNDLAGRPMLLAVMAMVHLSESLPDKRSALLDKFVDLLLFTWDENKSHEDRKGHGNEAPTNSEDGVAALLKKGDCNDRNVFRSRLNQLAFEARQKAESESAALSRSSPRIFILRHDLETTLLTLPGSTHTEKFRRRWVTDMLYALEYRAGILVPEPDNHYSLPHKLQEFMAAGHLLDEAFFDDFASDAAPLVDGRPYWEEVVVLAAGLQAARGSLVKVCKLAEKLIDPAEFSAEVQARRAVIAGQIMKDAGISNIGNVPKELGVKSLKKVRDALDRHATSPSLPWSIRSDSLTQRGWLEQLPHGVGCRRVEKLDRSLPDICWIDIDSGPFLMGSDTYHADEQPSFTCRLIRQACKLSRFPVTVAQFEAFVDAGGYEKQEYWSAFGWEWRQENKICRPEKYSPVFRSPNHPCVGVSWFEADAFCQWLNRSRWELKIPEDWNIHLPSEAQWERAARHTDGRTYPWGNDGDPADHCNMEDKLGHTSAVGLFAIGNAKCGAADMAGNVWEWCSTKWLEDYNGYEQRVSNDREGNDARVVRGGSWNHYGGYVRGGYRYRDHPLNRYYNRGFRLAASPISVL